MDLRTGATYATQAEALLAGVPASDIAEIVAGTGPFKGRMYVRIGKNLKRITHKEAEDIKERRAHAAK